MKKKILSILITILALCTCMFMLTACGGDEPPAPKYYTITWQNYDGSVLETDTEVAEGVIPTYDGTAPTKTADAQYTYEFSGWNKEISAVTGDTVYTAKFNAILNSYTVTWKNWDGSVLELNEGVNYGTMSSYAGETPTKQADAQYTYTFIGWDSNINIVTGDITYTAQFSNVTNSYNVTWQNWDGNVLELDENVEYGMMPSYDGETPTRPATAQYTYTFSGWEPTIATVTGNVTYAAQFSESINKYTVTWENWDGSVLEVDDNVEYGVMPTYAGETPTRPATAQYTYTFSGWAPTIDTVTGNVAYVAQYSYVVNQYTITWQNWDGTVLEVDENIEYGSMPAYDGTTPTKLGNAQYTYTFVGWSPFVETVTGNATYIAQFSDGINSYIVTWKNWDGTVLEVDENIEYGATPTYNASVPTKEGNAQYTYAFSGWDPTVDTVTGNVTYVAQFEKVLNKYKVTWKNDDGTVLNEEHIEYGTMPSFNGTPIKDNERFYYFVFKAWTPEISAITEDTTYTAVYDKFELDCYTITYTSNSSTFTTITKSKGETITITSITPTLSGYDFVGWNNIYEDTVYQPGDSFSLDGDINLVAMWKKHCQTCSGNSYVVETIDCDRCSSSVNGVYVEGIRCSNCDIDYGFIVINGVGDVCQSCYYNYGKIYKGYHVTCTKCGGRGTVNINKDCASCYGSGYDLPSAPTVESVLDRGIILNTVEGYEYSIDGINFQNSPVFSGLKPNIAYNLYQRQKTNGNVPFGVTSYVLTVKTKGSNTYYITYDLNGGENNSLNNDSYAANSSFKLYSPTRDGYDFVGWQYDGAYIEEIDETFNTDIELKVIWKTHNYLLSFDLDGGSFNSTQEISVTYVTANGSTVKKYAVGEKVTEWTPSSSEVFLGWYLEKEYITRYDFSTPLTDGMVLYAKYYSLDHVYNADRVYYNVTSRSYTCSRSEAFYFAVTSSCTIKLGGPNNTDKVYVANITTNRVLFNATLSYGSTYPITVNGTPENPQIIEIVLYLTDGDSNMVFSTSGMSNNSTIASASFTCLEQIQIPNPTKPGYGFIGWTGSNGNTPEINLKTPSENLCDWHLKANWAKYEIKYNLDGGSATNPTTYTIESDDIVLSAPERVGYSFVGWISSDILEPTKVVVIPSGSTGDREYTAVWIAHTYTITLDANGGDVEENSVVVTYDQDYTLPIPTRTGYAFECWVDGETGFLSGTWTKTTDITLMAKWRPTITYTVTYENIGYIKDHVIVTFDYNYNGSNSSVFTLKNGETLNYPTVPTRSGYAFAGWYLDNSCTIPYVFSDDITDDITLYAKWHAMSSFDYCKSRYYVDIAQYSSSSGKKYFSTYTTKTYLTNDYYFTCYKSGTYTFYVNADAAASNHDNSFYISVYNRTTASAIMSARLDGNSNRSKVATFYANAGDVVIVELHNYASSYSSYGSFYVENANYPTSTAVVECSDISGYGYLAESTYEYVVKYDEEYTLLVPFRTGYTFGGWYNGDTKIESDVWTYKIDMTLTALWIVNTYSVTLDANGGELEEDIFVVTHGQKYTLPTPTRTGYNFLGWYNGDNQVGEILSDTKLVAKWKAIEYQISYNLDGATNASTNPSYYTINDEITLVAPTKLGYIFLGWTGSNGEIPQVEVSFSGTILCDLEYIANWELDVFTIEYVLYEGINALKNPSTYTIIDTITLKPASKEGYTFVGWFTDSEFENAIESLYGHYGDLILYAKFTANTYQSTFDVTEGKYTFNLTLRNTDGYNNIKTYKLESGEPLNKYLHPATRSGSTFVGWIYDNGEMLGVNDTITADTTLTALWVSGTSLTSSTSFSTEGTYKSTTFVLPGDYQGDISYSINIRQDLSTGIYARAIAYITIVDTATNEEIFILEDLYTERISKSGVLNLTPGHTYRINMYAEYEKKWLPSPHLYYDTATSSCSISLNSVTRIDYGVFVTDQSPVVLQTYDSLVEVPTNMVREGYDFVGWFTENRERINETYIYNTDQTFYAHWAIHEYSISYNLNDGINNEQNPLTYTIDDEVVLGVPFREGYAFSGWYTDEKFISKIDVIKANSCKDYDLYAKWEANVYSVILNHNGADNAPVVTFVSQGEAIKKHTLFNETTLVYFIPESPKEKMVFAGWYQNENLTSLYDFSGTVNKDTTLYAKWIDVANEEYVFVGSEINVNIDGNNMSYITLVSPKKQMVTISSKSELDLFGVLYNFDRSTILASNDDSSAEDLDFSFTIVLEAWEIYYIGYRANQASSGGDAVISVSGENKNESYVTGAYTYVLELFSVTYGTEYTLPIPSKEGCEFLGWFDSDGNAVTSSTWNYAQDTTLYAHWSAIN